MKSYPITDHRYREQQQYMNELAVRFGFFTYRPDYHGQPRDCYTVLFYTMEDEKHNRQVDRQPTSYSRSEAADRMKYGNIKISDDYIYRDAFFSFENTDANGMLNTEFGNHGTIDLRGNDWRSRLAGAILFAFTKKKYMGYVNASGGFFGIREADQTNNDYNRELIRFYQMKHGKAYMGNVNYYDEKRQQIVKGGGSIYTEYTGQLVHNFEFGFVVPCQDAELEKLIRQWNGDERLPKDPVDVTRIADRINKIGGLHLIWY